MTKDSKSARGHINLKLFLAAHVHQIGEENLTCHQQQLVTCTNPPYITWILARYG